MIGQTISHFHILEKIGEGGMGVVYKAEDTNLKRTVALKFLPRGLEAHEPERARFLQEAQAASAINHPNICTIHDISSEGDQQFIVMEYVDGKTLRQMVPVQKTQTAIDYAIQVGEALQEAHSKGIVHRDVKTDNIMVNSKNQIKVMDFGLAKLKGSLKLTKTSSTVGTLGYMAPEQIQGGEVDARSDIFSFGVVLYEMLTGHMPFRGEHEAAMVYSIVNEEAVPIQKHLPEISSELVHVLNRALEKDPNDRYQNVAEMVIDLRRLKKETSRVIRYSEDHTDLGQIAVIRLSVKQKQWLKVLLPIVGVLLCYLCYSIFFQSHHPRKNARITQRTIEIPFSEIGYPNISRDGKWIAFSAADNKGTWDYYFKHVNTQELKRVTFDSARFGNQTIDISPDGSQIAYSLRSFGPRSTGLWIASPLTGESRRLVDTGYAPIWRPDGGRIGYMRYGLDGALRSLSGFPEFWSIKPDGSGKQREFSDTLSIVQRTLCYSWSPDGNAVAFLSTRSGIIQEVFVYDLLSGRERQLTHLNSRIDELRWASNGWIFFSSNYSGTSNLWMVPAEGGNPIQFTEGTTPYLCMSISADCRTLLAYQRTQVNQIWLADLEGQEAQAITSDDHLYATPSFSPDGRKIAFSMGSSDPMAGYKQLYVSDLDGQHRKQLTTRYQNDVLPLWSPDEKWIAFAGYELSAYTLGVEGTPRSCVIDISNPSDLKFDGFNIPLLWLDRQSYLVRRDSGLSTWVSYTDGRQARRYSPDSILVVSLFGGKIPVVVDAHAATQGLYVGTAEYVEHPSQDKFRLIQSFAPNWRNWRVNPSPNGAFILLANNLLELWRVELPSGRKERLKRVFPDLAYQWMSISNDGTKTIYMGRIRTKSKLVVMENPFE